MMAKYDANMFSFSCLMFNYFLWCLLFNSILNILWSMYTRTPTITLPILMRAIFCIWLDILWGDVHISVCLCTWTPRIMDDFKSHQHLRIYFEGKCGFERLWAILNIRMNVNDVDGLKHPWLLQVMPWNHVFNLKLIRSSFCHVFLRIISLR